MNGNGVQSSYRKILRSCYFFSLYVTAVYSQQKIYKQGVYCEWKHKVVLYKYPDTATDYKESSASSNKDIFELFVYIVIQDHNFC